MNTRESKWEIDPKHFRRVMGSFATGVTVILAETDEELRGMTANAFMSGSLEPPLCVVSIAKRAHMHAHIAKAKHFSINVLAAGQENYAMHFAGQRVPNFIPPRERRGGIPVLEGTSATMTAELVAAHDCGDHTIYVGHIASMSSARVPPLLFHQGKFAALVPLHEEAPTVPEFW